MGNAPIMNASVLLFVCCELGQGRGGKTRKTSVAYLVVNRSRDECQVANVSIGQVLVVIEEEGDDDEDDDEDEDEGKGV
jgi:hypothetical protein